MHSDGTPIAAEWLSQSLPHASWVTYSSPPPPQLDANSVAQTLAKLTDRVNKLSDSHRDLLSLVDFLEKNPGSDIRSWVNYEKVKRQMVEAANA